MVSGSEYPAKPRRYLQVACVGLLSSHARSRCSDEAQAQDVDTRSGCGLGEKGRGRPSDRLQNRCVTEAAETKTPAYRLCPIAALGAPLDHKRCVLGEDRSYRIADTLSSSESVYLYRLEST